jgi:hypothetical protein
VKREAIEAVSQHAPPPELECRAAAPREAICRAIPQRRTCAAMDKMLVEFAVNGRPMGEEFETAGLIEWRAEMVATAKLARVASVKPRVRRPASA